MAQDPEAKKKKDENEQEEKAEEESSSNEEEEGSDSDEDEEMPEVEPLAKGRERRANAGNKMAKLLEGALRMQEDEFYKTAYEGEFAKEDDNDDVDFDSDAKSEGDVVDSDFDLPEEEDEPVSDAEADGEKRKKREPSKRQAERERARRAALAGNKWVYARLGGKTVKANVVDEKTQKARLEEAKETERINLESLAKYEQMELEKKKKRGERSTHVKKYDGPRIRSIDGPKGKIVIYPEAQVVGKAAARAPIRPRICVVTGKPARYTEPLTGLPYANVFAYKVIVDQYHKFLRAEKSHLPQVQRYFDHFDID